MKNRNSAIRWFAAFLLAFLFTSASTSFAQTAATPSPDDQKPWMGRGHMQDGEMMQHRLEHLQKMKEQLGLTDDQVAKIKAVWEANKAKLKADREAVRAAQKQMGADSKAVMEQVKSLLTPDQIAKMKQLREDQRTLHNAQRALHQNPTIQNEQQAQPTPPVDKN